MKFKNPFNVLRRNKKRLEEPPADLGLLPPPPVWSRVMIWTLSSGSILLIIWSIFTKVEETIILPGEIITSSPEVRVTARDPGTIRSILVKPHQSVKRGDALMIYGDDETIPRISNIKKRIELLDLGSKKLTAIYDLRILQSQEQNSLDKDLLKRLQSLLEAGAIQETQVLEKRTQVSKGELSVSTLQEEKQRSIHQNQQNKEELITSLQALEAKRKRFTLVAPVTGFIQTLRHQTAGERIQQGEVVVTIVPDQELIGRVSIPSRLSAPIGIETEAILDVDAFPSSDFSTIKAEISSLSPTTSTNASGTANQKSYDADLRLIAATRPDRLSLEELRPGMSITARLKLRDKPIIATIFKVLTTLFDPINEERVQ